MNQKCYCYDAYGYPVQNVYDARVQSCPGLVAVHNDTNGSVTAYWINGGPSMLSECSAGSIPGVCHSNTISPGSTSPAQGFKDSKSCAWLIDYPFVVIGQGTKYCAKWKPTGTVKVSELLNPNYATVCVTAQDAFDAIKNLIAQLV